MNGLGTHLQKKGVAIPWRRSENCGYDWQYKQYLPWTWRSMQKVGNEGTDEGCLIVYNSSPGWVYTCSGGLSFEKAINGYKLLGSSCWLLFMHK